VKEKEILERRKTKVEGGEGEGDEEKRDAHEGRWLKRKSLEKSEGESTEKAFGDEAHDDGQSKPWYSIAPIGTDTHPVAKLEPAIHLRVYKSQLSIGYERLS
jgi:hypothetical protein